MSFHTQFSAVANLAAIVQDTALLFQKSTYAGVHAGRAANPDDPIGVATVTFAGVIPGSEIRVHTTDGVDIAGVESCSANQVLTWPAYSTGSPNNTVRITIVSMDYDIKQFNYEASLGSQSIPVQPGKDKWYNNPA